MTVRGIQPIRREPELAPAEVAARTWDITVCVMCMEHVNDCNCDLDGWTGDEPPTMTLTVALEKEAA